MHTIDQVPSEDQHVLNNIRSFRGGLEDAFPFAPTQDKALVSLQITFYSLPPLFLPHFVDRLDGLEVILRYGTCSYCALPWYRPSSDVVL